MSTVYGLLFTRDGDGNCWRDLPITNKKTEITTNNNGKKSNFTVIYNDNGSISFTSSTLYENVTSNLNEIKKNDIQHIIKRNNDIVDLTQDVLNLQHSLFAKNESEINEIFNDIAHLLNIIREQKRNLENYISEALFFSESTETTQESFTLVNGNQYVTNDNVTLLWVLSKPSSLNSPNKNVIHPIITKYSSDTLYVRPRKFIDIAEILDKNVIFEMSVNYLKYPLNYFD